MWPANVIGIIFTQGGMKYYVVSLYQCFHFVFCNVGFSLLVRKLKREFQNL